MPSLPIRIPCKLPVREYIIVMATLTSGPLIWSLLMDRNNLLFEVMAFLVTGVVVAAVWFLGIAKQHRGRIYILHDSSLEIEKTGKSIAMIERSDVAKVEVAGPVVIITTRDQKRNWIYPGEHAQSVQTVLEGQSIAEG